MALAASLAALLLLQRGLQNKTSIVMSLLGMAGVAALRGQPARAPKLAKAKTYRVTVEGTDPPGDGFAVRDQANNEMANDKVWSFKTKRN